MSTLCFKHRKRDCECIVPQKAAGFIPASEFLDRRSAHEIFYSCGAFKENVAYTPEVVQVIVQNYITVANELVTCFATEDAGRMAQLVHKLQKAGWKDDRGSGDSRTDS